MMPDLPQMSMSKGIVHNIMVDAPLVSRFVEEPEQVFEIERLHSFKDKWMLIATAVLGSVRVVGRKHPIEVSGRPPEVEGMESI